MELGLVLLGAVVGAIFYSVIRELTRTTKNKREIENEIEYLNKSSLNGNDYKINALEWVLNKKPKNEFGEIKYTIKGKDLIAKKQK